MPVVAVQRSGEEAVKALIDLHDEFKAEPEGARLTQPLIALALGIRQTPTISRWFTGEHFPTGAALMNLEGFLAKARNRRWLRSFIKEKSPKGRRK